MATGIKCLQVNRKIRRLADKVGISEARATALVSLWQTEKDRYDYPSANELNRYKKELESTVSTFDFMKGDLDSISDDQKVMGQYLLAMMQRNFNKAGKKEYVKAVTDSEIKNFINARVINNTQQPTTDIQGQQSTTQDTQGTQQVQTNPQSQEAQQGTPSSQPSQATSTQPVTQPSQAPQRKKTISSKDNRFGLDVNRPFKMYTSSGEMTFKSIRHAMLAAKVLTSNYTDKQKTELLNRAAAADVSNLESVMAKITADKMTDKWNVNNVRLLLARATKSFIEQNEDIQNILLDEDATYEAQNDATATDKVFIEAINAIVADMKSKGTPANNTSVAPNAHTYHRNSDGVIYGYRNGDQIAINSEHINPNTVLHEYTHLWFDYMSVLNFSLYDKAMKIAKEDPLWKELEQDPFYSKALDTEHKLASEVLARRAGEYANARFMDVYTKAKENDEFLDPKMRDGILDQKMQEVIDELGKEVLASICNLKENDIKKLDSDTLNKTVLYQFLTQKMSFQDMFAGGDSPGMPQQYYAATLGDLVYIPVTYYREYIKCASTEFFLQAEDLYFKRLRELKDLSKNAPKREERNQAKQLYLYYSNNENGFKSFFKDLNKNEGGKSAVEVIKEAVVEQLRAYIGEIDDQRDDDGNITDDILAEKYRCANEIIKHIDKMLPHILDDFSNRTGMKIQAVSEEDNDDDDAEETTTTNIDYKVRDQDPLKGSPKIKMILSTVYNIDEDGYYTEDLLGNYQRIDSARAYAILLRSFADEVLLPEDWAVKNEDGTYDMVLLKKISKQYPFMASIIEPLSRNPSLVAEFYNNFRMDWIDYTGQEGSLLFTYNETDAFQSTYNTFISNYQAGIHLEPDLPVFTDTGKPNREFLNSDKWKQFLKGRLDKYNEASRYQYIDSEKYNELIKEYLRLTAKLFRAYGFNVSDSTIELVYEKNESGLNDALGDTEFLENSDRWTKISDDEFNVEKHAQSRLNRICRAIGTLNDSSGPTSFLISAEKKDKKTRYSYAAPNMIDTLFRFLKSSPEIFEAYMNENYAKYDFFYDKKTGKYKNDILRWCVNRIKEEKEDGYFVTHERMSRKELRAKDVLTLNGVEYRKATSSDIFIGALNEYLYGRSREYYNWKGDDNHKLAYYSHPIFSDSPCVKFVTAPDYYDRYDEIIDKLVDVVKQELGRITICQKRKEEREKAGNGAAISNFDKNGLGFCFFPKFNSAYNFANEEMQKKYGSNISIINKIAEYKQNVDSNGLDKFLKDLMTDYMEQEYKQFRDENKHNIEDFKISEQQRADSGYEVVYSPTERLKYTYDEASVDSDIKRFFYNNTLAQASIIQLTIGDLALYKDNNGVEFQKRCKEVYAAGKRLFTGSRYGRTMENVAYLKDDIATSTSFTGLKESLKDALDNGKITKMDYDSIINGFKAVNGTDAQAFRSWKSFRSILDMMGRLSPELRRFFEKLEKAEKNNEPIDWDMSDFNLVFQTIKPFVYTHEDVSGSYIGDTGENVSYNIKVHHQHKNSEFLLLAARDVFARMLDKSGKLKALDRFMNDNDIDVVMYESACKVGNQISIDLRYSENGIKRVLSGKYGERIKDKLGDKEPSFDAIKKVIDSMLDDEESLTQEAYNSIAKQLEPTESEAYEILNNSVYVDGDAKKGFNKSVVHSFPFTDYMIAQETPEHLFDAKTIFGSQYRQLILANLPDNSEFRVSVNGIEYTKSEICKLWRCLIAENLIEAYETLTKGEPNKENGILSSIENLQKKLFKIIDASDKYPSDIKNFLEIIEVRDPRTGKPKKVFNIPLDFPSKRGDFQELMSSMFKNNVTKQKTKGGNAIMVANVGLTDELQIKYNKDGSIKYFEIMLPAHSRELFKELIDPKTGLIDESKLDEQSWKVFEGIGYRIPTEGKYSMVPFRVKGFLPEVNGSSVMLPADVTRLAGSDFDVDKLFIMLREFRIDDHDYEKAKKDHKEGLAKGKIKEDDFLTWFNQEEVRDKYKLDKKKIRAIEYIGDTSAEAVIENVSKKNTHGWYINPKAARDNMLIDIGWAILTHKDMKEQLLHPGHYENLRYAATWRKVIRDKAMVDAFRSAFVKDGDSFVLKDMSKPVLKEIDLGDGVTQELLSDEEIINAIINKKVSQDDLKSFVGRYEKSRNPLSLSTFVYFHEQNMAGKDLVGIFANNNTAIPKYQTTSRLSLRKNGAYNDCTFMFNGEHIETLDDMYDIYGNLVSFNTAELSAAAVDNGKDPVCADAGLNRNTANIANLLMRLGFNHIDMMLFITGGCDSLLATYEKPFYIFDAKHPFYTDLKNLGIIGAGFNPRNDGLPSDRPLTSEDLAYLALTDYNEVRASGNEDEKRRYYEAAFAYLVAKHKVTSASRDLMEITMASKSDSPNGAIARTMMGSTLQVAKVKKLRALDESGMSYIAGFSKSIRPLKEEPDDMEGVRKAIQEAADPMGQAFFSLGIDLANKIMSQHFLSGSDRARELFDYLCSQNPYGMLNENAAQRFEDGLILFALSDTKLFGDEEDPSNSYLIKRKAVLENTPALVNNYKLQYPHLNDYECIKRLYVNKGVKMRNSGTISATLRDEIKRDFDLMSMSNIESKKPNGESFSAERALLKYLVLYSFYKDGLKFAPDGYSMFLSANYIGSFPEIRMALTKASYGLDFDERWGRFVEQFIMNNSNILHTVDVSPTENVLNSYDNTYRFNRRRVTNFNAHKTNERGIAEFDAYDYILIEDGANPGSRNEVYYKISETKEEVVYKPAFHAVNSFSAYNINQSAEDISTSENLNINYKLAFGDGGMSVEAQNNRDGVPNYNDTTASKDQKDTAQSQPESFEEFMAGVDQELLDRLSKGQYDSDGQSFTGDANQRVRTQEYDENESQNTLKDPLCF